MADGGRLDGRAQRLLLAAGAAAFVGLMWLLERVGVSQGVLTPVLLTLPLVLCFIVGLRARTMSLSVFDAAERRLPAAVVALALPAVLLALVVLAGDGAALRWGAVAGLVLHAALAPLLHDGAGPTPGTTLAGRFGSAGRIAALVVVLPAATLVFLAMLRAAAGVVAQALVLEQPLALQLVAAFLAIVAMVGGFRAVAWMLGIEGGFVIGFAVLLAGLLVVGWWHAFVETAFSEGGAPVPAADAGAASLLSWAGPGGTSGFAVLPFVVALLGVAALPAVCGLTAASPGRGEAGRVCLRAAALLAAIYIVVEAAQAHLSAAVLDGSWLMRQMSILARMLAMLAGAAAFGFHLALALTRDIHRPLARRASTARKMILARLCVLAVMVGGAAAAPLAGAVPPAIAVALLLGLCAAALLPALVFSLLPGGHGAAVAVGMLGAGAIVIVAHLPAALPGLIAQWPMLGLASRLGEAAPLWGAAWACAVMAIGLALSRRRREPPAGRQPLAASS